MARQGGGAAGEQQHRVRRAATMGSSTAAFTGPAGCGRRTAARDPCRNRRGRRSRGGCCGRRARKASSRLMASAQREEDARRCRRPARSPFIHAPSRLDQIIIDRARHPRFQSAPHMQIGHGPRRGIAQRMRWPDPAVTAIADIGGEEQSLCCPLRPRPLDRQEGRILDSDGEFFCRRDQHVTFVIPAQQPWRTAAPVRLRAMGAP